MIAIQNIYYLLLYAWDLYDEGQMTLVAGERHADLLNLLTSTLLRGIDRMLRRGLDRGYISQSDDLPAIRGKLDLSATIKRNLLPKSRAVCELDELSYNVLHNQVVKSTLARLLSAEIDRSIVDKVRVTLHRLAVIDGIALSNRVFRQVRLHRNTKSYRLLIDICRLLYDQLTPKPETGRFQFRDFARDEVRMRKLFERFLFNFFRHEQTDFRVRRKRIQWANVEGDIAMLPSMLTDVTLYSPARSIIIDAKYSKSATQQSPHGSETVRSDHLYQLFAYLKNIVADSEKVDGLIIYPLVSKPVDANFSVSGHQIRVATIDLNQHWRLIRRDLLALLH